VSSFATIIMLHAFRARHKMRRCARVAGRLFAAPAVRAAVVHTLAAGTLGSTACSLGLASRPCGQEPADALGVRQRSSYALTCFLQAHACSAALMHVLCSGVGVRDLLSARFGDDTFAS
jgi:hypothetical protein